MSTPSLFPAPRSLTPIDAAPPAADEAVRVRHDPELPPQGYRLRYAAGAVALDYADAAGLRYAQQTLDQLRGLPAAEQTAAEIEDWPDFGRRGFMLDVSRDRVPTRASLARLVEVLSLARINQFELYLEHAFAYSGHEAVWRDASPLTPEDVRWLDDLCASRGIELVANQNTFGHWERWLAHDAYRDRGEIAEPVEIGDQLRPPSTLAPTADNAAFVTGLVEELTSHLRSRRVNVGADETWELGLGASRERAEREGLGTVYVEYLAQVISPWLDRGYSVEFWADILANHPEVASRVPAGAIPIVWQYDSPSLMRASVERMPEAERRRLLAHGVDVAALTAGFVDRARPLIDSGTSFWVAPGTSTWLSLVGRLDNAVENLEDAAAVGLEHGSGGYLITAWGDHGMYDPPVMSYGPIVYGAAVSWGLEANRGLDLSEVLNTRVFADETGLIGEVLTAVGGVAAQLDVPMFNASPLFRVLLDAEGFPAEQHPAPDALQAARTTLREALDDLHAARPASPDAAAVRTEIRQAVHLALFAVDLLADGILAREPAASDRVAAGLLLDRLDALLDAQREAWLLSSRHGGLDDSIARLAPLRRSLAERAAHTG
ncbi:family 20 glycosylhydrolase [Microbacterium betulae]|uniref:beta-N-acetylhexosaminidase n=1 Tax=Microbacterium betulae TaxID=2981139 RepID=A0AA97FJP3_9MICO|nr:family 20 glycosylhydrolase [Microbacterium sp. AB]WOF24004.1 family 20 glycosylhydrolase [Microbacterium sp. AB]